MQGKSFQTSEFDLKISRALSLRYGALSDWITIQSFETAPTITISRTTETVPENLHTRDRISIARSSAAGETCRILFDITAIPPRWLISWARPSAQEHRWDSTPNISSVVLFPGGAASSSSISSKTARFSSCDEPTRAHEYTHKEKP